MKIRILLLSGIFFSTIASAETTSAITFAQQAGIIAGTAQACGVNTEVFTSRINEALRKITKNNIDHVYATSAFQNSLQQAKQMESTGHAIECSQVQQDFSKLPILKDDYSETVLAKLTPDQDENGTSAQPSVAVTPEASAPLPTTAPAPAAPPIAPSK